MNTNHPLVSIVLPTYNGACHLRESIASCLAQTYYNLELIIVDDGSDDDTSKILDSMCDCRIVRLRHSVNRGLPAALNTGFLSSHGSYLTWTSDDNYYHEAALEKMQAFMKRCKCDFAYADYYRMSSSDSVPGVERVQLPSRQVLHRRNNVGPCFLYGRFVMDCVGLYDEDAFLAEDYDYWIRVSKSFRMCHLPEPLYYYRDRPDSLSARRTMVRIVSLLVLLKNQCLSVDAACRRYSEEVLEPRWTRNHVPLPSNPVTMRIGKTLAMINRPRYSKLPRDILEDYSKARISIEAAKSELMELARTL